MTHPPQKPNAVPGVSVDLGLTDAERDLARPYVPVRRWLVVGCDESGPFPGIACEIAALSFDESDPLIATQTYVDLAAKVAPHVRRWNVTLPDPETGEPVAVPAPIAAGGVVFDRLDKGLLVWLRDMLIQAPNVQQFPVEDADPPPPIGQAG
jgi:hypothetical protein